MRDLYLKNGECFLIMFSIVSQGTFSDVVDLYQMILKLKDQEKWPGISFFVFRFSSFSDAAQGIVLVGNKKDLESQRTIPYEQASELANRLGIPYIETSAKTSQGIADAFNIAVLDYCTANGRYERAKAAHAAIALSRTERCKERFDFGCCDWSRRRREISNGRAVRARRIRREIRPHD
jgi:GTPase SAR1 family protein